jgi:ribA/ribD-fused uncharacterized protein
MTTLRTREKLAAAQRAGERFSFLFFWGHTPEDAHSIDASCLSQWFPSPFEHGGIRYLTAEHFIMAAKARLFGDTASLGHILAARTPAEAKALGRQVSTFDEPAWSAARSAAVVEGNVAKFGAHADLRDFLLATGDRVLVEASPRDCIWGIGLDAANPRAADSGQWRGQNLLGFALMEARRRLSGARSPSGAARS